MEDKSRPTPADNNPPGAPELGKGVTPPSAPLVADKFTGPVFRAQPIKAPQPAEQAPNAPFDDAPQTTDDSDDTTQYDEHQARIEYLQSLRQGGGKKRKQGKKKLLFAIVLILVLLAAGGAGAYYLLGKKDTGNTKKPAATKTQQSSQTSNDTTANNDQAATAETKPYDSTTFSLSLAYPGDWKPAEANNKLTITSPVVSLTDANGQAKSGRIVLTVRPRQDKPAEFTAGAVVAVLDSDKVNYTKPTSTQRGSTYLSYLQYASTTTKGGLDGIYITGDYGYKYGQTVRLAEIAKIDPLIDVTFVSCADSTCAATGQTPLTVSSTAWKSDTANRPAVETMLKSLAFN